MKLGSLLSGIAEFHESFDKEIRSLTSDSRKVVPDSLFVAIPGEKLDGHRFIPEAVKRGASAIVCQRTLPGIAVPQIPVVSSRRALALLAARFYGEPSRALSVFGVTGTNGKTTLTYLLESILREAGRSPAVAGTINYRFGANRVQGETTTPDPVELQRLFAEWKGEGATDVVMEVSSHALSQDRVVGIHFDGAAFTNLSRDHLDYHKDLDDYFEAKLRLFTELLPASVKQEKFAVINLEDPRGALLSDQCPVRPIRTSLSGNRRVGKGEVVATTFNLSENGIKAQIDMEGKTLSLHSELLGRFNLENILVAVGIGVGAGLSREAIGQGIEKVISIPGRLERIPNRRGVTVLVDYAHTPEALATVCQTLRPLCRGRLITLFGCGGDRDRGKRPLMGEKAARWSDLLIVTSDNPRTEDPEAIIREILKGVGRFPNLLTIPDRREALAKGVELARPGDTLLVAGKGHEDYQIIGTQKVPFSDQEILRELLA